MLIKNILFVFLFNFIYGQEIVGSFTNRTTEDTPGLHLETLSPEPVENLFLPQIETERVLFGTVFNSFNTTGNEVISFMVIPKSNGEWLYIDINNDENLTNDGGPWFFLSTENEFEFYIKSEKDTNQISGRVLYRVPPYTINDSEKNAYFRKEILDENGNLRQKFLNEAPYFPSEFTGRKGTFYFDDRISFSRGYITIEGDSLEIGIYDFDENGLFNDDEDLLFIDTNQDEELSIFVTSEIFKLKDIIKIGKISYKISYVDPYGKSIRLVSTEETPTNYFIYESRTTPSDLIIGKLDSSFWNIEVESLNGQSIPFINYFGNYLLLNFWGEWCAPCIKEIPALSIIENELSNTGGQLIGMLITNNENLAKNVIDKYGILWPQVIISEKLLQKFKISSYPTNLLIFPDGRTFVHANQVDKHFFNKAIAK